jgi:large subunit ribosomal protein L22
MSKAVLKYVRVSPIKARLVAREVQGMNAELALASLDFMPNKAAKIISKVIASAVANGEYEPEDVVIVSCRVDRASYLKRWRPRARGMATRILKPTSHIYVEVAEVSADEKKSPKKSDKKESKKAEPKKSKEEKAPESESKTTQSSPSQESKSSGDDLTKIKGIGKVYKERLHSEGFLTFEDVANMSEEQIKMIETKYNFRGDFSESVAHAKEIISGKDA